MTTLRALLVTAVVLLTMSGCTSAASPPPTIGGGLRGTATAGPVCPVEKVPPDPACAPRPIAGAVLVVRDATGREVGRATTAADGTFSIALEAGDYVLEPQPVQGLMGTAPPRPVTVVAAAATTTDVVYDTGIRGPVSAP